MNEEDTKAWQRFKRFTKRLLLSFLSLVAVALLANLLTGHRLQFLVAAVDPFTWVTGFSHSPDGHYQIFAVSSGCQGVSHTIYASRWFHLFPTRIMEIGTEDFSGKGPIGSLLSTIWSSDGNRIGLVCNGWLVDFYDLKKKTRDKFPTGLYPGTKPSELQAYHNRITGLLDKDTKEIKIGE